MFSLQKPQCIGVFKTFCECVVMFFIEEFHCWTCHPQGVYWFTYFHCVCGQDYSCFRSSYSSPHLLMLLLLFLQSHEVGMKSLVMLDEQGGKVPYYVVLCCTTDLSVDVWVLDTNRVITSVSCVLDVFTLFCLCWVICEYYFLA